MRLAERMPQTALVFTGLLLTIFAVASVAQTTVLPSSTSQNVPPVTDSIHSEAPVTSQVADRSYYRIAPGDTLDITVYGAPDLSQKVRVTSNGEAYLPLVNYVHVAGLNVEEAQGVVEQALKKGNFLTTPHVSIFVAEYASGVVVMGEVMRPGIYPVTASKGLLFDILTQSGRPDR